MFYMYSNGGIGIIPWNPREPFYGIQGNHSMESRGTIPWNPASFHWNPGGIVPDSIWNIPFQDHSTWNPWCLWNGKMSGASAKVIPYGFHGMAGGIPGNPRDSRWITWGTVKTSYGMEKWLGPQPKSFHMDSMEWLVESQGFPGIPDGLHGAQ